MKPLRGRALDPRWAIVMTLTAVAFATGCSRDGESPVGQPLAPSAGVGRTAQGASVVQVHPGPPAGLATIDVEGRSLSLWPYTGTSFTDASDPINLVFVGDADPVKIRAALLALNGDRTAFGIPNVPPFNERWADALGSVQTAYTDAGGWSGSVIQLRLGAYGPIRVHVRLFRTGAPFGASGTWTVGNAHFEVLIPGTADHWVLSWMLARDIVTADLARSGLLVAPPALTGVIGAAPTYRDVPPEIYNPLPVELKGLIGGPLGSIASPFALPSDGRAAVFHLEGAPAPQPGTFHQQFTIEYGQLIPKPLCSDGPYDYVFVQGPVELEGTAGVDDTGRYSMSTRYSGRLTVTPMDVTQTPPVPAGAPFTALVSEVQDGQTGGALDAVFARSRRLGQQRGGAEILVTDLKVSSAGIQEYRLQTQCPEPQP